MSHCILKTNMTEPKGLLSDLSDIAEGYFYWMKNELSRPWLDFKRAKGGDNWVVHHATDDDDEEKNPTNRQLYTRV